MSSVGKEIKRLGLMKAYEFLDRNPEENLPKLMDWFDRYASDDVLPKQREIFREIIAKKDSNWYSLMLSVWDDIDDGIRKTLFENLILNANALASSRAKENREKYNCNIPWAITMGIRDTEMIGTASGACPTGAASNPLTFDEWDDVIEQAKELGTFMFGFQGGEPLDSKMEIIALCNKHDDCEFMVFTNGDGITEEFADEILRVKNLIVVLKVTATPEDVRLKEKSDLLFRKKIPYAVYGEYTRETQDLFASERFFDELVKAHVKLGMFFSTLPLAEDRMFEAIHRYRQTKPIVTIDFCKDRDIIGGCMAGGRYYLSIDSEGNYEPCFFVKDSDSNVRSKSLLQALQSPLFQSYHDNPPHCTAEK